MSAHPTDLSLAEARRLVRRAADKAEAISMSRGAVAVIGASGAAVSASRLDECGVGGMARARSKAWIAATQQIPSALHLERLVSLPEVMRSGFVACSPEAVFPGAGGLPVVRDGRVVGGIAVSGAGIGPFIDYPGAEHERLLADGRLASGEDLIVHYALGIAYVGQHGNEHARWNSNELERWMGARFGPPGTAVQPADRLLSGHRGSGMEDPPAASHQDQHRWASKIADAALAEAGRRRLAVCVAVVDARGDVVQLDRMDAAALGGVELSEGVAAGAALLGCPSEELLERFPEPGALALVAASLPVAVVPAPGGLPITAEGRVVGALGIAGPPPATCRELAAAVLEAVPS